MHIAKLIRTGLDELPFATDEGLIDKAAAFIEQLARWNKTFNLTGIRSEQDMVRQHLMDSLSIAPYVTGMRILDVGSGAGLPGLPLAILYPDKNFILLDSNGKKTRFMTQVVIDLGLSNVQVVQSRVEEYRAPPFDQVLCRAFAPLATIVKKVSHLVAQDGSLLAMKGKINADTLLETSAPLRLSRVIPVQVPLIEAERCLVELVAGDRR
jgi:16S rRNA (guanine527-N7)-methyltransferase